jgi:hypothetical protein
MADSGGSAPFSPHCQSRLPSCPPAERGVLKETPTWAADETAAATTTASFRKWGVDHRQLMILPWAPEVPQKTEGSRTSRRQNSTATVHAAALHCLMRQQSWDAQQPPGETADEPSCCRAAVRHQEEVHLDDCEWCSALREASAAFPPQAQGSVWARRSDPHSRDVGCAAVWAAAASQSRTTGQARAWRGHPKQGRGGWRTIAGLHSSSADERGSHNSAHGVAHTDAILSILDKQLPVLGLV